ncbi:hypothetical protein J2T57_001593 [Natronocella acetinitrilica]|uniref:Uncharacterized protein n=1 Tax=Natronocella acetinitrilica TaxID=414046 RepID=A0AAE3G2C2_9GAMM|nr:hypothetical protein [Natronocella acetinitrilica]MCP1674491.1 hypothetical protein [Natronocella acetinitrilica]
MKETVPMAVTPESLLESAHGALTVDIPSHRKNDADWRSHLSVVADLFALGAASALALRRDSVEINDGIHVEGYSLAVLHLPEGARRGDRAILTRRFVGIRDHSVSIQAKAIPFTIGDPDACQDLLERLIDQRFEHDPAVAVDETDSGIGKAILRSIAGEADATRRSPDIDEKDPLVIHRHLSYDPLVAPCAGSPAELLLADFYADRRDQYAGADPWLGLDRQFTSLPKIARMIGSPITQALGVAVSATTERMSRRLHPFVTRNPDGSPRAGAGASSTASHVTPLMIDFLHRSGSHENLMRRVQVLAQYPELPWMDLLINQRSHDGFFRAIDAGEAEPVFALEESTGLGRRQIEALMALGDEALLRVLAARREAPAARLLANTRPSFLMRLPGDKPLTGRTSSTLLELAQGVVRAPGSFTASLIDPGALIDRPLADLLDAFRRAPGAVRQGRGDLTGPAQIDHYLDCLDEIAVRTGATVPGMSAPNALSLLAQAREWERRTDLALLPRLHDWEAGVREQGAREAAWEPLLEGGERIIDTSAGAVVVRELTTASALHADGLALNHCVDGLEDGCWGGRYRVFSLTGPGGMRSALGVRLEHADPEIEAPDALTLTLEIHESADASKPEARLEEAATLLLEFLADDPAHNAVATEIVYGATVPPAGHPGAQTLFESLNLGEINDIFGGLLPHGLRRALDETLKAAAEERDAEPAQDTRRLG